MSYETPKKPKHAYVDFVGEKLVIEGASTTPQETLIRLNVDTIWGRLEQVMAYMAKGWRVLGYGNLNPHNEDHQAIKNTVDQITGAVAKGVEAATALQAKVAAAKAQASKEAK